MSYHKDVLDIKRNLLKESSTPSNADYYDPAKIILDARKAFDGIVPYSGLELLPQMIIFHLLI